MDTPRTGPSEADAGMEVAGMGVGLGIITMALFPFALPGLLLFVVPPLLLLAVPVLLLAAVLVPPPGRWEATSRSGASLTRGNGSRENTTATGSLKNSAIRACHA